MSDDKPDNVIPIDDKERFQHSAADNELFVGDYKTEADALADLDAVIDSSGLFRVYREVRGYYMHSRPGHDRKTARIDRLCVPGQKLRDAGWGIAFGIEAKCSGVKIGPAVAQAIDYTWALFRAGSTYIYPEWIFLWPFPPMGSAIGSVMVQNRIGAVHRSPTGGLSFVVCGTGLLHIWPRGEFRARPDLAESIGKKTGSR